MRQDVQAIDAVVFDLDGSLPVLPGAADVVRHLADRWQLGLASSSPRILIDEVLKAMGLASVLSATRSTEEVGRGKPAPDVYLSVADQLEVPAGRCVAVEDSSNGLRSAAAAGMTVIAIPRPGSPPDAAALALAARVLPGLGELPATIQRLAEAEAVAETDPDGGPGRSWQP